MMRQFGAIQCRRFIYLCSRQHVIKSCCPHILELEVQKNGSKNRKGIKAGDRKFVSCKAQTDIRSTSPGFCPVRRDPHALRSPHSLSHSRKGNGNYGFWRSDRTGILRKTGKLGKTGKNKGKRIKRYPGNHGRFLPVCSRRRAAPGLFYSPGRSPDRGCRESDIKRQADHGT